MATCFDRKWYILFKVQKGSTQRDPISFTVEYKMLYKEIPIYN